VSVAKWLASSDLNVSQSRIMIEKPFGYDLESARTLNSEIQKYFNEDQIYRVDHYLGKNYVQEFYHYKTTEMSDWYDDKIKEIRIVAREELAMEGRWEYYDKSWATRDFLQNHLLQILSIATMQKTDSLEQVVIQQSKLRALQSIKPLLIDPNHDVIMGQYEGYRNETGVDANSRTETYIRVHLKLDAPWANTDIILETGKALDKKESSITLVLWDGTEKVFSENSTNKNNSYETLIGKALNYDSVFFVPWENVEAAWHVVDDLLHCTDNCPILKYYTPGSKEV
jgi:glucose-6-phosphate 1-dehydrogenase